MAIDGTEYSKPMFDRVVFFAGAYSCEGNITFLEEQEEKTTLYIMTNSSVSKRYFKLFTHHIDKRNSSDWSYPR